MFIKLIPVNSSTLSGAGYNATKRVLRLQFSTGIIYDYHSVPEEIFTSLMAAKSKGTYFNEYIKDHFDFEKISDQ